MVERQAKVVAPHAAGATLHDTEPHTRGRVLAGSMIFTDDAACTGASAGVASPVRGSLPKSHWGLPNVVAHAPG